MGFTIEVLDSQRHDRSKFCCGQESLDRYISQQASQDLKKRIAATHVLIVRIQVCEGGEGLRE
jgi:hypothetical protein